MGLGLCPASCLHHQTSKMDIANKNEFIFFMQRAVEDQTNDCYIELYNILLRAFITADCDFDGQVSEEEFGGMIEAAAALPKKFGFDWWQGSSSDQFKAIDENGDGSCRLTNGWDTLTKTTRTRRSPWHLTNRTRIPSWPTARSLSTLPPTHIRRSTGSAGSASRPLMLTGTVRSPALSSPPCSM